MLKISDYFFTGLFPILLVVFLIIGLVLPAFSQISPRLKKQYMITMVLVVPYGVISWLISIVGYTFKRPIQELNLSLILFFYLLIICVNCTHLKQFKQLKINKPLWLYSPFMALMGSYGCFIYLILNTHH